MIVEIALGIVLAVLILNYFDGILGPALIALSIAIVLALVAAAVYLAFMAPGVFFTLLAIGTAFFGFSYWEAAREAKRAAARQTEAKLNGLTDGSP